MPGRLPTPADFSKKVTLTITPPPDHQPPTNILILLHGLGDSHDAFAKLGRQLSLPETACIAMRAPKPLPFDLGGFHWGDDLFFDQASGEMDADTGFKETMHIVGTELIQLGLVEKCGYKAREIILFGFGQGGMAALAVAANSSDNELGGAVSVGGALPASTPLPPVDKKSKTPVVLCKAVRNSAVSPASVNRIKDTFEFVEVKEWNKSGDSMPSNRDEMMPIMQFFARRLKSTRGVPAGSVEIS